MVNMEPTIKSRHKMVAQAGVEPASKGYEPIILAVRRPRVNILKNTVRETTSYTLSRVV